MLILLSDPSLHAKRGEIRAEAYCSHACTDTRTNKDGSSQMQLQFTQPHNCNLLLAHQNWPISTDTIVKNYTIKYSVIHIELYVLVL